MTGLTNLIREIHRRSLWQVLGIYLAGSWVALQVVEQLTEAAGLPDWVHPFSLVLLVLGFPIVMATAFVQEGLGRDRGPERRSAGLPDENADVAAVAAAETSGGAPSTPSVPRRFLTWRNAIAGGVLAFAALGLGTTAWILLGSGSLPLVSGTNQPDPRSIAVLPFTSVRTDEENESFRIGMHDALLTQLAKVGELRVIARTSMLEYEGTTKQVPEIASELGVATVVEGSIQRAADVIQINVQLINASTNDHRWADSYTRDLSAANLIAVQGEIVRAIAQALEAQLAPQEQSHLDRVPTENSEAYDFFVRARGQPLEFGSEMSSPGRARQIALYQRAIELDPSFALAHAWLSYANSFYYQFGLDRSQARIDQARASAEQALALQPNLAEAHLALGTYHYVAHRDYEAALAELEAARLGLPQSVELESLQAAVMKRSGDMEGALRRNQIREAMDPRSVGPLSEQGVILRWLGRYDEAEAAEDRTLALTPLSGNRWWRKTSTYWYRGDLDGAREVIASMPGSLARVRLALEETTARLSGRNDEALAKARALPSEGVRGQEGVVPKSFFVGRALYSLGDLAAARAELDSARVLLEGLAAERPEFSTSDGLLARTYAMLGRRDEAIRTAQRALERWPPSRDVLLGAISLLNLAKVYTLVGENDLAIETLETLASIGAINQSFADVDPRWDPLRGDPRFEALVDEVVALRTSASP